MPSQLGKSQTTVIADNIMTGDISLSKGKNISKDIQEMPILQNDKTLKDTNSSKDKLISKGENFDDIIFYLEEKIENIAINT